MAHLLLAEGSCVTNVNKRCFFCHKDCNCQNIAVKLEYDKIIFIQFEIVITPFKLDLI